MPIIVLSEYEAPCNLLAILTPRVSFYSISEPRRVTFENGTVELPASGWRNEVAFNDDVAGVEDGEGVSWGCESCDQWQWGLQTSLRCLPHKSCRVSSKIRFPYHGSARFRNNAAWRVFLERDRFRSQLLRSRMCIVTLRLRQSNR